MTAVGSGPAWRWAAACASDHDGTAALAFGGGAFAFSRWAESVYDDAMREPDDARQEELWKSANQRRYVALGLSAIGSGIGYLGAAIYLQLRGGREDSSPAARRSIRVTPTGGATSLGVSLRAIW